MKGDETGFTVWIYNERYFQQRQREKMRRDRYDYTGHIAIRGKGRDRGVANVEGPDRRHGVVTGQKRKRRRKNDTERDCQKND